MTKKEIKALQEGMIISNLKEKYLVCYNAHGKKSLLDLDTYVVMSFKEFPDNYFKSFIQFIRYL